MEKFFVSRPIFALSLAIVIVIVGLISILNLPIEQYPDITPPVVRSRLRTTAPMPRRSTTPWRRPWRRASWA